MGYADHRRTLILGQIKNIVIDERLFGKTLGCLSFLMSTHQPEKGLARVFIPNFFPREVRQMTEIFVAQVEKTLTSLAKFTSF